MRLASCVVAAVLVLSGCRAPYMSEYSDAIVSRDELPAPGIARPDLITWFEARGYVPGARVLQSEAELRRRPGEPLVYALQADRSWWQTAHRSVRHACVTTRSIYYRLDEQGRLDRAIYNHRSQC